MAVAALALEQLGFVLDLFPVVGVGGSVLRLRDDGPALRELGVELQELLLAGRHVVLRADRFDGALGLAQRAIDALLGIDDEHVRPFVEAIDGAHLDAVGVLALDTGFRDDEGHVIAPQGAPSGAVRRRRNSATTGTEGQARRPPWIAGVPPMQERNWRPARTAEVPRMQDAGMDARGRATQEQLPSNSRPRGVRSVPGRPRP